MVPSVGLWAQAIRKVVEGPRGSEPVSNLPPPGSVSVPDSVPAGVLAWASLNDRLGCRSLS